MNLLGIDAAPGDIFAVARPQGVYGKDERWSVTGYIRLGAVERGGFMLECANREPLRVTVHQLATLVDVGVLKPTQRNAADRERQVVALKASSPMRAHKAQDDESGLALFQHFDEPRLL